MKKNLIAIFVTVFSTICCFSQDVIVKKSGEEIQAKVLEVTPVEIKYKRFDNREGPTLTLLKSEVTMIRYQNGTKDIFDRDKPGSMLDNIQSNEALFRQGQSDASIYYKGYKGAGTGTLLVSLLSPLVGLIPAISCSSTPPKDINLNYPDAELIKQRDYFDGYMLKSKKIKKGRVWTNWGIAFGVNLAAVLILSAER